MNIAFLAVPFILSDYHIRSADKTLKSIQTTHSIKTYAIVNACRAGSQDTEWITKNFNFTAFNEVNCLARAWNKGIEIALADGAEYVIVSNLDLQFHPEAIDRLVACALRNPNELIWSTTRWFTERTLINAELTIKDTPGTNWSCYMVNRSLFARIGLFDEVFAPAYQEDSDMVRRLQLAGITPGISAQDSLVYHGELGTMKGCLEIETISVRDRITLAKAMRHIVTDNDKRYIEKWGGLPGSEKFDAPYNGTLHS